MKGIFNRNKVIGSEMTDEGLSLIVEPNNDLSDVSTDDLAFFLSGAIDSYMKPMNETKFKRRNMALEKMIQYYEKRIHEFDESSPVQMRVAFGLNLKACIMSRQRLIQHQTIANDIRNVLDELERRRTAPTESDIQKEFEHCRPMYSKSEIKEMGGEDGLRRRIVSNLYSRGES